MSAPVTHVSIATVDGSMGAGVVGDVEGVSVCAFVSVMMASAMDASDNNFMID